MEDLIQYLKSLMDDFEESIDGLEHEETIYRRKLDIAVRHVSYIKVKLAMIKESNREYRRHWEKANNKLKEINQSKNHTI